MTNGSDVISQRIQKTTGTCDQLILSADMKVV
jgi:hypothetical protein